MENNKKDRTVLKSYFKTNAVPTELNFRDFIDAGLNQKDDGITKIPDGPIAVQSASTNEDLIHFYRSFEDKDATWSLGLKGDSKSGLSINEGATANRLFIEPQTGNTGIGTTSPAGKLDVNANDEKGLLIRSGNGSSAYAKTQLTFGYNGSAQYRHAIKTRHHSGDASHNAMDFYLWNQATNNKADDMPIQRVLTLNGNGNVGVNLPADQHVSSSKLQVIAGDGNNPESNGIYLFNNRNEQNQHAIVSVRVAGSAAGNPYLSLDVKEAGGWAVGVDNKAGQALKFGSDWNTITDNTRMTMLRTGNIGVGLDQPTAKFQINTNEDPTPEKNGLLVSNAKNTAGQNAIIGTRVAGGEAGNPMFSLDVSGKASWLIGLDNKTNSLKFSSNWHDLNTNTRMTILNDGRVGIGASPVAKLHVEATADNGPDKNGLMVSNASPNNNATLAVRVNGSGTGNPMVSLDVVGKSSWLIGVDNQSSALKFSNSWNDLNSGTRLTILNNGKVGIGLTAPEAPMHIEPGAWGQTPPDNGVYVYNKKNEAGQNAIIAARVAGGNAGNPYFSLDVAGIIGWSLGMDNKSEQAFRITNSWDHNLADAVKLSILRNGNVGIGQKTPESRLHIAGKIRINDGTEGSNKILASNASGEGSWIEPFMRRDFRPYRKITYIWDGFGLNADDGSLPMTRVETRGGAYAGQWNNNTLHGGKPLLIFNNLAGESASTNQAPAKGVYIKMPVSQGKHHSLLVSALEADRWSTYSVWLVDWDGSSRATRIGLATGNYVESNRDFGTSYMIGPRNGSKEFGYHGWLAFAISSQQIDAYMRDGQVKFLITCGPNTTYANELYASGFAMVENPYGFTQLSATSAHWGLNGEGLSGLEYGTWENEGYARLNSRTKGTVYVRVVDKEKDLLVTFLEHSSNWFGGNLRITVGNDGTVFGTSSAFTGISHMLYYGRQHSNPQSILIPKEIVKAQLVTVKGIQENMLRLNLENRTGQGYHFRGIDTEAFSQRFMD